MFFPISVAVVDLTNVKISYCGEVNNGTFTLPAYTLTIRFKAKDEKDLVASYSSKKDRDKDFISLTVALMSFQQETKEAHADENL